jgi:cytochrome c biogenesis protein CcmG/thiol:disulfide interchange protein DsbE
MIRAAALALVVTLGAAACISGGGGTAARGAAVNTAAPLFTTHDLDDNKVALREFRGNLVVLNFWASWCTPCRREFPVLAQAATRDHVVVLGVVYNDTVDNAKQFMRDHGGTWPALKDDGQIAKAYRVGPGIPATIVIGPTGRVLVRHIGEVRAVADVVPAGATSRSPTTSTATSG